MLQAIIAELNSFLQHERRLTNVPVVISNLVQLDGSPEPAVQNRIVCSLINIEEEAFQTNPDLPVRGQSGALLPSQGVNLLCLFSSGFTGSNYLEGLKQLDAVMNFFSFQPMFSKQNTPALPDSTERITIALQKQDFNQINQMFIALGAKQLPSLIYKLRWIRTIENRIIPELRSTL